MENIARNNVVNNKDSFQVPTFEPIWKAWDRVSGRDEVGTADTQLGEQG